MYTVVPLNGTQSVRSTLRDSGVQPVDWSEIRNEHGQTVGFCIDRKFAEAVKRMAAEPNAVEKSKPAKKRAKAAVR